MLAPVLAVALCLCVLLSITSRWCSVETHGRIELVFSLDTFSTYSTLRCKEIRVSRKIRVLPSLNFFLNSGLGNLITVCRSSEHVTNLAREW